MKTLIIGRGEVGKALAEVLDCYAPEVIDKQEKALGNYEILHICFPYSEEFQEQVVRYRLQYRPKYVVIHSTVPVGTSRAVDAIHSPIRGIHPNLTAGIRTFVKFIGGKDASKVADYFRSAGLRVMLFDKQEATELGKLLCTEYYRACIEFTHRAKAECDKHGVSFYESYVIPNMTYNDGYQALGHSEFIRPVLQAIEGPIGGHCVMPNKGLLELSR